MIRQVKETRLSIGQRQRFEPIQLRDELSICPRHVSVTPHRSGESVGAASYDETKHAVPKSERLMTRPIKSSFSSPQTSSIVPAGTPCMQAAGAKGGGAGVAVGKLRKCPPESGGAAYKARSRRMWHSRRTTRGDARPGPLSPHALPHAPPAAPALPWSQPPADGAGAHPDPVPYTRPRGPAGNPGPMLGEAGRGALRGGNTHARARHARVFPPAHTYTHCKPPPTHTARP